MKTHTSAFKNAIKQYGKEIDSVITYELNGETITLGNEELNSVMPHYEGAILKSVMKQLDLDSNVEIPVGTELNYQFGVKVRNESVEDYRDNYDYVNFGNYIVYSVEKKEDTRSYNIVCYDKLLLSMKDYEKMEITYPITVRDYISAICNHLDLTFKNAGTTFANYNKEIPTELYMTYDTAKQEWQSLGYTFRDVLDELAQVTASTICINEEDDKLEIRYITDSGDTIDAEYLDSINVVFGETTKPINTIVLSRSGGSDKIYKSYPDDLPDDEKNAIEIADNQIMNFNDRDGYLPDILNRLYGLTYSLNDYKSKGICYYNLCDRYNIEILGNTYSCVMFNDEINVTQGLEENVYTELPEESETDYTKADKTDRRINQTYLIVDKQNQEITSVISTVDDQNSKISTINQKVDELTSQISDIADITTSGESTEATFDLDNINTSEPIMIKVRPMVYNISYLYPRSNLYPSGTLYMSNRKIRFHNKTTSEDIDYELPDDLLWYDSETFDEFYLDYDSQTCQVTKRCGYNADGSVYVLTNPVTTTYTYPTISLTDGNYTISILGYSNGYIFTRLMSKNIYTTQFYTKVETDSKITQKANEIELGVSQTLTNYSTTDQMNAAINVKANEITSSVSDTYATKTTTNTLSSRITQNANSISAEVTRATGAENTISGNLELKVDKNDNNQVVSMLNASANEINITGNRIKIQSDNFELSKTGSITATSGKIGNWNITGNNLYSGSGSSYVRLDANENVTTAIWCGAEGSSNAPFRVTKAGALTATNATVTGSLYSSNGTIGGWTIGNGRLYASANGYTISLYPDRVVATNNSTGTSTMATWVQIVNAGRHY